MLRLTIALCLILAAPAAAKPGDLDRTFGHRGRLAFAGDPGYTWASDVMLRADGSPLVVGATGRLEPPGGWTPGVTLAQLTTAGRIERRTFIGTSAFGTIGALSFGAHAVRLPDGDMLAAAWFDNSAAHPHIAVFRIRADGSPDASFGTNGAAILDGDLYLNGLGVDRAGRIVVAATRNRQPATVVLRLLPDGAPDATYAAPELPGDAGALLVRGDGSAFVATTRAGTHRRPARAIVRALEANGRVVHATRLTLYDTTGYQARVTALVRGPRGSVLAAGYDARDNVYGWITRLRADGAVDRRFGRRTIVSKTHDVFVYDMTRDRRGRIVLAGVAYDDNAIDREDLGRSYFAVARLQG